MVRARSIIHLLCSRCIMKHPIFGGISYFIVVIRVMQFSATERLLVPLSNLYIFFNIIIFDTLGVPLHIKRESVKDTFFEEFK